MKIMRYKKNIAIVVVSFLIFFFSFSSNVFHIMDDDKFYSFEEYSESLILGRLVLSQQDSILSFGALTGRVSNNVVAGLSSEDYRAYQYTAYKNAEDGFDKFNPYYTQTGGQALFFAFTGKYLTPFFNNAVNLRTFYLWTSALSALALSFLVLWIYLELGFAACLTSVIGLTFSHHFIQFGKNLWWALYSFYIPLVVLLFYLRNFISQDKNWLPQYLKVFVVILGVIVFKIILTGYEYITTFVIMIFMPYIYYAIKDRWLGRYAVLMSGVFFMAAITAIIVGFIILSAQIAEVKGTFSDGIDHIIHSYTKRTSSTVEMIEQTSLEKSVYQESLTAPLSTVLEKYLSRNWSFYPITKIGNYTTYKNILISLLLLAGCLVVLGWYQKERKISAFGIMLLLSIFAPLSWIIIFKGHSFIHSHMNVIVWYMPFLIFGYAGVGVLMNCIWRLFNKKEV